MMHGGKMCLRGVSFSRGTDGYELKKCSVRPNPFVKKREVRTF